MQVVKHDAKPVVTETVVVSAATPETFDLIGLSFEEMARLYILLGNGSGSLARGSNYSLFVDVQAALGLKEWPEGLPDFTACIDGEHGERIKALTGRL